MIYRELGHTGRQVGVVGLGCEGYERLPHDEAVAFLRRAIDRGVNCFDVYSPNPETRRKLAEALGARRGEAVIQGHLGAIWENGQYRRTRDLAEVKEGFRGMLADFGTDYIDVGMIHYVDTMEDLETILGNGMMNYIQQLENTGAVRCVGMSSHNPAVAKAAIETGHIDVLLFSSNPAYDMQPAFDDIDELFNAENYKAAHFGADPAREDLYNTCLARGVGITVMKPYAGGNLLSSQDNPLGAALTPVQCLHYALTRPGVAAVLPGCKDDAELDAALRYCEAGDDEKDYGAVLAHLPLHRFAEKCVYCGHCAPCTVGIDVAAVSKFLSICEGQGEVPETVADHYKQLSAHAGDCIGCGACLARCPFGVDIIARMAKAAETFGY